jgi:hypothetical protein
MQPALQTQTFSTGAQYAWRAASSAVVAGALSLPGSWLGGVLFGLSHYFFVSTYRTWVSKPQAEQRPQEVAQSIAEIAVKFFVSHVCCWGFMHFCGFKWTFAHIVTVSLAHLALGLLVTGILYGLLHLMHVSLLRAVG